MRLRATLILLWCCLGSAATPVTAAQTTEPHRSTISLDGVWDIEESAASDQLPKVFSHTVPVPGLAHSATPGFANVDEYQTKQLLSTLVYYGRYPQADYDKLGDIRGTAAQSRNYFWYRKSFRAPARHAVAILKVNKAQFGTTVFLNGTLVGEHDACFTAAYFDVSRAIRWDEANELVVRVGAHPGVLPATVSHGTDFEKWRWTPGIYDSVTLITADNPVISTVQVAPQLASARHPVASVLIQTELHNYADRAISTAVQQQVFARKSRRSASALHTLRVRLSPGETKLVKQVVPLAAAHLWSPEDPFLYRLSTRTTGDDTETRFGMREFHFDTVTQRGYLNGRVYFLRGSNIALHRFFEDPQSGTLPWNEAWLQRLLVAMPKQLHWNAFRFTIGPVPDRWLEIADENGLLIEYEYPVWVGSPIYSQWRSSYDTNQMIAEYREWMRDNWNHPSVFMWDATNESFLPEFASKVMPAVRALDLSKRAWENSYNDPGDANDPVEDHTYFLEALSGSFDASQGGRPFQLTDLEWADGPESNPFTKSGHAKILNEYGWIWLNRDGSPTLLTQTLYQKLLGDRNTTENRRVLAARVLGGETEMWRAYRRYAGVMHFVYLTCSGPTAFTSDNFADLPQLQLEAHVAAALEQAFRPLGVYLNYWHPAMAVNSSGTYNIYMVNDEYRPRSGTLRLAFMDLQGREAAAREMRFSLPPLGAQSYTAILQAPAAAGPYVLQARAEADDDIGNPTISRRDLILEAP
jgi:hypothetical protein